MSQQEFTLSAIIIKQLNNQQVNKNDAGNYMAWAVGRWVLIDPNGTLNIQTHHHHR